MKKEKKTIKSIEDKKDFDNKFTFLRETVCQSIREEMEIEDDLYFLAQKINSLTNVLLLASLEENK